MNTKRFLAEEFETRLSPTCRNEDAFSLVEVAFAIAILSFSLMAMMSLVPVALKASRDSIDKNLEIEILQVVRASLLNSPYSSLADSGSFFFDADASLLGTTEQTEEVRFKVDYVNEESTNFPAAQTALGLRTSRLRIENVLTKQVRQASLHLPDNGL